MFLHLPISCAWRHRLSMNFWHESHRGLPNKIPTTGRLWNLAWSWLSHWGFWQLATDTAIWFSSCPQQHLCVYPGSVPGHNRWVIWWSSDVPRHSRGMETSGPNFLQPPEDSSLRLRSCKSKSTPGLRRSTEVYAKVVRRPYATLRPSIRKTTPTSKDPASQWRSVAYYVHQTIA